MTQKPDNPQAFPHWKYHQNGTATLNYGITLRDYFADRAKEEDIEKHMWKRENPIASVQIRTREEAKYAYADAMLKARDAK